MYTHLLQSAKLASQATSGKTTLRAQKSRLTTVGLLLLLLSRNASRVSLVTSWFLIYLDVFSKQMVARNSIMLRLALNVIGDKVTLLLISELRLITQTLTRIKLHLPISRYAPNLPKLLVPSSH